MLHIFVFISEIKLLSLLFIVELLARRNIFDDTLFYLEVFLPYIGQLLMKTEKLE